MLSISYQFSVRYLATRGECRFFPRSFFRSAKLRTFIIQTRFEAVFYRDFYICLLIHWWFTDIAVCWFCWTMCLMQRPTMTVWLSLTHNNVDMVTCIIYDSGTTMNTCNTFKRVFTTIIDCGFWSKLTTGRHAVMGDSLGLRSHECIPKFCQHRRGWSSKPKTSYMHVVMTVKSTRRSRNNQHRSNIRLVLKCEQRLFLACLTFLLISLERNRITPTRPTSLYSVVVMMPVCSFQNHLLLKRDIV